MLDPNMLDAINAAIPGHPVFSQLMPINQMPSKKPARKPAKPRIITSVAM